MNEKIFLVSYIACGSLGLAAAFAYLNRKDWITAILSKVLFLGIGFSLGFYVRGLL